MPSGTNQRARAALARLVLSAGCALAVPHAPAQAAEEQTGLASWYGENLRGRRTASGERFDPDRLTAAHRSLPMHTRVEVTALDTGRSVVVRINDRGPFHGRRIVDLSAAAARELGGINGARRVRLRPLPADPSSQTAPDVVRGPGTSPPSP